jgi:hypothetical protein
MGVEREVVGLDDLVFSASTFAGNPASRVRSGTVAILKMSVGQNASTMACEESRRSLEKRTNLPMRYRHMHSVLMVFWGER